MPYGNPDAERVRRWRDLILEEAGGLREDGSLLLNMDYFDYATGLKMCCDGKWTSLFGLPPRARESFLDQRYMDLSLAIQQVTEEIVLRLAETAKQLTGPTTGDGRRGGPELRGQRQAPAARGTFKDIWNPGPRPDDAGGALGQLWPPGTSSREGAAAPQAALDHMQGAYLGPEYGAGEITRVARRNRAPL